MSTAEAKEPTTTPATAPVSLSNTINPSVYVGDLSPDVTEAMLWEHFRKIGQVLSVRVCCDFQTKKSLGYGYVNFSKPAEATAAIDQLNGSQLLGRACRVDRIQRDPTARKSGICNVVIKGLPEQLSDIEAVRTLFTKYGRITSIRIPADEKTNKPRGYAYINFDSEEAAARAVKESDGHMNVSAGTQGDNDDADHQTLTVERFQDLREVRENRKKEFTNTFISGIRSDVDTEDKLRAILGSKYGAIISCKIRATPGGNGEMQAMVAFETHESASKCVDDLHEKDSENNALAKPGTTTKACRFMAKKERELETEKKKREKNFERQIHPNLYVKHIDDIVDEDMLTKVFTRFGDIINTRVMRDDNGVSREFAFVSFRDQAGADAAIAALNGGVEPALGKRPLYIAHCVSKDERRVQVEEQVRNIHAGGPQAHPGLFIPGLMSMGPGSRPGPGGFPHHHHHHHHPGMMYNPHGHHQHHQHNQFRNPQQQQQQQQQVQQPGLGGNNNRMLPRPNIMMMGGVHNFHNQQQLPPHGGMMHHHHHQHHHHFGHHHHNQHNQYNQYNNNNNRMNNNNNNYNNRGPYQQHQHHHHNQQHHQNQQNDINHNQQQQHHGNNNQGQPVIDLQYLSTLPHDQQKNVLGERLYEHISRDYPQQASKITGMLLEMDNSEILNLIESSDLLNAKVTEALAVLSHFDQGSN